MDKHQFNVNHSENNIIYNSYMYFTYTSNVQGPFMVSLWSNHGTFDITKSYRNLELRNLESIVKFP